jgi:hypothetical protein
MTFRASKRAAALLAKRRISKNRFEMEYKESMSRARKSNNLEEDYETGPIESGACGYAKIDNHGPNNLGNFKLSRTAETGSRSSEKKLKREYYIRRQARMVHSNRTMKLSRRIQRQMERKSLLVPEYSPLVACKLSFRKFDNIDVSVSLL